MTDKKISFRNQPVDKLQTESEMAESLTHCDETREDLKRGISIKEHVSIDNLHKFAREGEVEQLICLVKHFKGKLKKRINFLDVDKMSPLHYAARFNHFECIKVLVEQAGADVNILDEEKATPIHFGAKYRRKARNKEAGTMETIEMETSMKRSLDTKNRTFSLDEEDTPTKENSVILYLVSKGANPNAQDSYGCTPLHFAAISGNEVAAKQLMMLPEIDTEVKDNESMTPLHLACSYGHFKIAKMILDKSTNLFNCEETGCIPFHAACGQGDVPLVNLLIKIAEEKDQLHKMLHHTEQDHKTPLHYAVQNKHIDVVRICLEKGAHSNAMTNTGQTALHLAAHCGSVELVKLLSSFGGNLKVTDNIMQTPMHCAAQKNHVPVIEYLIENGADVECRNIHSYTPLLVAAFNGHNETIKSLIEHHCDLFATEKSNKSSLFLAVVNDYPEAVKTILNNENGKTLLHTPDFKSNYPIHIASKDGNANIMKILLEAGAADDSKDVDERSPMHLAAKFGRTQIVKILGERLKRSLVNDGDEDANTPLHLAAKSGHPKIIQLLLNYGADKNARNLDKYSPLDYAAAKGNLKAAQVLLQNGAEVDSMDKSKITPLYLACKNGHEMVASLLLQHHADISIRVSGDSNDPTTGCNPLDAAIDNAHRDCALAILKSDKWEIAMRNQTKTADGTVDTPMRKMIRKMPDVAEEVFKKCKVSSNKHPDHVDFSITYNFEFLEDSYASWGLNDTPEKEIKEIDIDDETESVALDETGMETYDENEKLSPSAKLYIPEKKLIMANHPLMVMVTKQREELLKNHIVSNLLQLKWVNYGIWVYYINLSLYLIYMLSLLVYMLETVAPYKYHLRNKFINFEEPICIQVLYFFPKERAKHRSLICKYLVTALSILGLLKEFSQLVINRLNYLSFENLMEVTMYVLSFLTVSDFSMCQYRIGIRDHWQWQLGAVASFLAIMNLVLFIRKVPFFGIFVVMFTDVLLTFIRFLPLFFLFIFAFAFAFFMLMGNHLQFFDLLQAFIQTIVWTAGEFEFNDVFNSQWGKDTEDEKLIFYNAVTYAIFMIFILMINIITMNLLVGLAVDDIKAVQEKAALKRMGMQVSLVLDVEGLVPECIRRRYICRKVIVYPNQNTGFWKGMFGLGKEVRQQISEDEQLDDEAMMKLQLATVTEEIVDVKHKVKNLNSETQLIAKMLAHLLKISNIEFEEEDIPQDDFY